MEMWLAADWQDYVMELSLSWARAIFSEEKYHSAAGDGTNAQPAWISWGFGTEFSYKQLKINNSLIAQCEWNSHQDLRVSRRLIILLTIWQTLRQLPGWQHWVPVEIARGHPSLRELLFQCSPKPNTFRNDTGEKAANEDSGNKIQYKNWWIAQQFSSRIFKI